MDRIRSLTLFQKVILILLAVMLVVFTVVYTVTISRVGFLYQESILCLSQEDGSTIYAGKIQGKQAVFTVSPENSVTFRHGETVYGPYTVKEEPSAVPQDNNYLSGVEICQGDEVIFRGGYRYSGNDKSNLMLFDEDGSPTFPNISFSAGDGPVVDRYGKVVDMMEPSLSTILKLVDGPELTSKGIPAFWFMGLFVSIMAAVSILFADELFRWNLSFHVQNPDDAEPSDWYVAKLAFGWTALPVIALICYLLGLQ